MKKNLAMIKKKADIFGLLFLGYGATILRCPLLNILVSAKNILVAVLEIVDCQGESLSNHGYFFIHDDLFDRIKWTHEDQNNLWEFSFNELNEDES